ncbi:MAG: 3-hydroxyacyl-CoA dehydrogenase/enoyl-CoA hydratase family protein [Candidatus Marinimicrobia bacterium]|nr:3-hydroxyacyl-CoA dehydrogenase/enoyl-CoA hydratase family protein [Candidatus Neomarinimicrobiota bacterium]
MAFKIEKVAVLGAGVMGAQIATHLSNAGIPSYLFDMNQELAEQGLEGMNKLKPSPVYNPKTLELITPCNYDDHLDKINEVDWVVEVIAERLDWKQGLFEKIVPKLNATALLTSNTSGLALSEMAAVLPDDVKKRFFITHFFNPPRYMKLVELVGGPETDRDAMQDMATFLEDDLGKGVVWAKDTANFIANRIGVYGMMLTLKLAREKRLSIPDVDALTGTLIGHMKSATFRTGDVVGLDTLVHVAENAYDKGEADEARDMFLIPDYLQSMLDKGWLGQKTQQGFYKKDENRNILALNLDTLEYELPVKKKFDAIRVSKNETYLPGKLRSLVRIDDVAGKFLWELNAGILIYSANRLPEISDDIVNIDNAMKWGFGWDIGPFEVWDALGVKESTTRMQADGRKIPSWVTSMLQDGFTSFYGFDGKVKTYYDPASKSMLPVPTHLLAVDFDVIKKTGGLIKKDWSASLIDLGDGVAAVTLHSVLQPTFNPIDGSIISMFDQAVDWVQENGYKGLVIASEAPHFSAGANLALMLRAIDEKDWDGLDAMSKAMQDTLQKLRFAPFPVVAAPHSLALGGGYETIGACDRIVAAAELYTGLVEVGVGLIPGAGGNLRMIMKTQDRFSKGRTGAFQVAQKAFEAIGFAKISMSAKHAVSIGYLTKDDVIIVNGDHRVARAKAEVLSMSDGYAAPEMRTDLFLPGKGGRLAVKASVKGFLKSGKISEHDALIAEKLAFVLTGGDRGGIMKPLDEQYLLDIEREAFVSLGGEPKTRARIEYMLKRGKPLRN